VSEWSSSHLAASIAVRYRRNGQDTFDSVILADEFGFLQSRVRDVFALIGEVVKCRPLGDGLWQIEGEPELGELADNARAAFTLAYHLCGWQWVTLTELMGMLNGCSGWSRERLRRFILHSLSQILPIWDCSRRGNGLPRETVFVWIE